MQNIQRRTSITQLAGQERATEIPARLKPAATPPVRLKQIALPTEHGGWGLLFEPIVVGLAIAFSFGGLWIAFMTIGAFLTRQPLKMLVIDRLGMRVDERAKAALKFVMGFGAIFAIGLAASLATAGPRALIPFAAVLPLAAVQIYFDFSRKSRNLLPELGGAIAISASVSAIALAGGLAAAAAVGLWAIMIARLVPSVLYVRERLLEEKGKPFSRMMPLTAHALALVVVAALAYYGLGPVLAGVAMVMLFIRAAEGLSPNRRKMKAMKIGVLEVIYGTLTVILIVTGYHAGL